MGRGAAEEAGDSLERSTEVEDMGSEGRMLKWFVTGSLLSLHRGFFGGIPELAVAHVHAWQAPKCYHSLDTLSISEGIGAVDVARDVGGCEWILLCTPRYPQSDQGVAESNLVRAR